MATPVVLYGSGGEPLHTEEYTIHGSGGRVLATITAERQHSVYITKSWTTAVSNVKIATPRVGGTLELLDLVISGSKKASGTLTVRWNDGSNTDNLFVGSVDDGTLNLAISYAGKVEGWKDAYLEYTTVSVWTGSLMITYVHHLHNCPTYAEWNSRR